MNVDKATTQQSASNNNDKKQSDVVIWSRLPAQARAKLPLPACLEFLQQCFCGLLMACGLTWRARQLGMNTASDAPSPSTLPTCISSIAPNSIALDQVLPHAQSIVQLAPDQLISVEHIRQLMFVAPKLLQLHCTASPAPAHSPSPSPCSTAAITATMPTTVIPKLRYFIDIGKFPNGPLKTNFVQSKVQSFRSAALKKLVHPVLRTWCKSAKPVLKPMFDRTQPTWPTSFAAQLSLLIDNVPLAPLPQPLSASDQDSKRNSASLDRTRMATLPIPGEYQHHNLRSSYKERSHRHHSHDIYQEVMDKADASRRAAEGADAKLLSSSLQQLQYADQGGFEITPQLEQQKVLATQRKYHASHRQAAQSGILEPLESSPAHASEATTPVNHERIQSFIRHLRQCPFYRDQICSVFEIDARPAQHRVIQSQLDDAVKYALHANMKLDESKLFIHQSETIDIALSSEPPARNIVMSTSTSSGKSLAFNIVALQRIMSRLKLQQNGRALYLFPTKALAQDQGRALTKFLRGVREPTSQQQLLAGTYDGDTPSDQRIPTLKQCHFVLSNPDMLHVGLLPNHRSRAYAEFFSNIVTVVVDEAHLYTDAFGGHTSMVLRRLRRVCSLHGATPLFICCSATIGNPVELATSLVGLPARAISNDGSPCGRKTFVLWNPPVTAREPKTDETDDIQNQPASAHVSRAFNSYQKRPRVSSTPSDSKAAEHPDSASLNAHKVLKRASTHYETARLLVELMRWSLPTIAFTKHRRTCELVFAYANDILNTSEHQQDQDLCSRIQSYRGGYNISDRRSIERRLFNGDLLGVVATNALEVGIDVGTVAATLHMGAPRSLASLWQQAGRAGRKEMDSLAILIAYAAPLDQYIMKHSEYLQVHQHENISIECYNHCIIRKHILCAAFEESFVMSRDADFFGDWDIIKPIVHSLQADQWVYVPELVIPLQDHTLTDEDLKLPVRELMRRRIPFSDKHDTAPWQLSALCWKKSESTTSRGMPAENVNSSPAGDVSLRTVDEHSYIVVDLYSAKTIDEIPEQKASFSLYPGSIVVHQGSQYFVSRVEHDTRVAYVRKTKVDYFTTQQDHMDVFVLRVLAEVKLQSSNSSVDTQQDSLQLQQKVHEVVSRPSSPISDARVPNQHLHLATAAAADSDYHSLARHLNSPERRKGAQRSASAVVVLPSKRYRTTLASRTAACSGGGGKFALLRFGRVKVQVNVYGFRKVKYRTLHTFDRVELEPRTFGVETNAVWIDLPSSIRHQCEIRQLSVTAACHSISHLMIGLFAAPLETECPSAFEDLTRPLRISMFTTRGLGVCQRLYRELPSLIHLAHQHICECPCDTDLGCPGCIQSEACKEHNAVISKAAATFVLDLLLEYFTCSNVHPSQQLQLDSKLAQYHQ
jgi:ATP-dependent helicase YprA (DUF1998 family)